MTDWLNSNAVMIFRDLVAEVLSFDSAAPNQKPIRPLIGSNHIHTNIVSVEWSYGFLQTAVC